MPWQRLAERRVSLTGKAQGLKVPHPTISNMSESMAGPPPHAARCQAWRRVTSVSRATHRLLRRRQVQDDIPVESDEPMQLGLQDPLLVTMGAEPKRPVLHIGGRADPIARDASGT